jgi:ADP-ribose pyrophosphatase YjhB (NUDIX family)
MKITRHFTATTIIVFKNKILLHMHKKLGFWLPVGGHINSNELPEDAAKREVKEESGLELEFFNPDQKVNLGDARQLMRSMRIILEDISQFHQHIDFIYYAKANTFKLNPNEGEVKDLRWFMADEIKTLDKTPINVKKLSLEALRIFDDEV